MATAKKLPSGSYRCLVYEKTVDGKRKYKSFTAKTKKEAEYLANKYLMSDEKTRQLKITIGQCLDNYIKSKENVISVTTHSGYLSMRKNLFSDIDELDAKSFNSSNMQEWIGNISVGRSPKTVKNAYGLLVSAITMYCNDKVFRVKLPQQKNEKLYVPSDLDIKMVMDYFENDIDMTIAICLAAFGTLRRSEVCGLYADDVDRKKNTIYIHQTLVMKKNREWVLKDVTKNPTSTRTIEMPKFVIDMLPTHGKVVNITPAVVSHRFDNYFIYINAKKFRFHDLRHYSASIMHAIGVPDVYIMDRGGWASDSTLKKIYRGEIEDYKKQFVNKTNSHFEKLQHEMQHK